jgi:hypothetical protein
VYEKLRTELDTQVQEAQQAIAVLLEGDESLAADEIHTARVRLLSTEKSSIRRSASQGLISMHLAESLLAEADRKLDQELTGNRAGKDGAN